MAASRKRRILGSLAGVALAAFGATGLMATGRQFQGPLVQRLCSVGLCADEFSVTRTFLLKQQGAVPGHATSVMPLIERALLQDNASGYRWTDLGAVEFDAGHAAEARYCFERAVQAAPRSPVVLFRAANFDWQSGDAMGALKHLYRVLSNPELADLYDSAFLTYSRLNVPLQTVLALGVPPQPLPAARFLEFEMYRQQLEAATGVWQWMSAHRLASDATAGDYCKFLADRQQPEAAAEAWRTYAAPDGTYRRTTWVFNGGFELPFRPSPFDWHVESTNDVAAERTDTSAHSGSYALRLQFLGRENAGYRDAFQFVTLPAGQWRLSADVKAEGVTTTEGLRLHVFDFYASINLDAWSEMVSGSTGWQPLNLVFRSGPGARLLRIEAARQPSLLFNDRVKGTVWIDEVQLTPEGAETGAAR